MLRAELERRALKKRRAHFKAMGRFSNVKRVTGAMLRKQVARCSSAVLRMLLRGER